MRERIAALRRTVRFRRWAVGTRRRLARSGCDLILVAPYGATFDRSPIVEVTRHRGIGGSGRGTLRIELGRGVHLGRDTVIEVLPHAENELRLDDGALCFTGVRFVLFGGSIHVGRETRARDGVTLKSSGRLVVGANGFVNNFSMIHCAREVTLAEHPQIAERVTIIDSDHVADGSDTYTQLLPIAIAPVVIERNVWIGAGAVILRGTRIGANSVVSANSTVRGGEYPSGWLVAGSPASPQRKLGSPPADASSPVKG